MPRHPPCALHSLSQQRQNNTHTTHAQLHRTHHPPPNQRDEQQQTDDTTDANTGRAINTSQPHNPPPTTRRKMHGCKKMLASTMQISNNNPTNTHTPPPRPPNGQTRHTAKHRQRGEPEDSARLIPQDPTVCLTPSPTNARQQVPKRRTHPPQKSKQTRPAPTIPLVNTTIATRHPPVVGARAP